jgi:hypothetical protein
MLQLFLHVIETMTKNNKVMIKAMDCLNIAMCHAFIRDKALMLPPLNFDSKYSSEKRANDMKQQITTKTTT